MDLHSLLAQGTADGGDIAAMFDEQGAQLGFGGFGRAWLLRGDWGGRRSIHSRRGRLNRWRKGVGLKAVSVAEGDGEFDGRFQFPDIVRPLVVGQAFHKGEGWFQIGPARLAQEVTKERIEVFQPMSEGRDAEDDVAKSRQKVPAKEFLGDPFIEVAVCCTHDADVDGRRRRGADG